MNKWPEIISDKHKSQALIFEDLNIPKINPANIIEPVSIASYKKYGITRQNLHYLMTHFHTFPHEFKDCLSKYYLLYWSAPYFISQLKDGTINHDNITYNVTYLGCTPENIKLTDGNQIKVSFRAAQIEFNIPPVVVISARKDI